MKANTELDTWKRIQAKTQRRKNRIRKFNIHRRFTLLHPSKTVYKPLDLGKVEITEVFSPEIKGKNFFQSFMAKMNKNKGVQKSQRGA